MKLLSLLCGCQRHLLENYDQNSKELLFKMLDKMIKEAKNEKDKLTLGKVKEKN
jgi:hypothetical protein